MTAAELAGLAASRQTEARPTAGPPSLPPVSLAFDEHTLRLIFLNRSNPHQVAIETLRAGLRAEEQGAAIAQGQAEIASLLREQNALLARLVVAFEGGPAPAKPTPPKGGK